MKYETLVDAAILADQLREPDWVVFDCRFALTDPDYGRRAYAAGHIPGARFADVEQDLSAPTTPGTGRHPLPSPRLMTEKLGAWGVDAQTQVVVYDDAGGAYAVRLWWLLRWLGHRASALLNGGFPAWTEGGRAVDRGFPNHRSRTFDGKPDDSQWVETQAIQRTLAADVYLVVDARAPERFRGEAEPIDPRAGHIPGALNLPYTANLDADGRFLPPQALRTRFLEAIGEIAPGRVVHMCGSGVTAVHNLLAMEIAGLSGSKLYPGSWSEWIRGERRPVAAGEEKD